MLVRIIRNGVHVHEWTQELTVESSVQIWDSQAKQWSWEKCEGVYKQSGLHKGVI